MNKTVDFELDHKYIAVLLEDKIVRELPGTARSTLKVETERSIELLATKITAHWRELRRPIKKDSYTCTFNTPSTGWQHFKQDYLPKWFIKRYPVQMQSHKRTVKFTRYATYPNADISLSPEKFGSMVIEDVITEVNNDK